MTQWGKFLRSLRWMPNYLWQAISRGPNRAWPSDIIIGLADHFEPSINPQSPGDFVDKEEQKRRLESWCREYPKVANDWRDTDGCSFRHTYFYPAEQSDEELIQMLAHHCRAGWGEIEIHLHHGINTPDTSENTRRQLVEFRDALASLGCLSQMNGAGTPRYAFVHGNWALGNSNRGRYCGVDNELQILADTGCFADFTLPSAPDPAQVGKINALYECSLPLERRAPHRLGRDLEVGRLPGIYPLIIEGPLMLDFSRRKRGWPTPGIENSAVTASNPPTLHRLALWRDAAIAVKGRPEWLFVKLHCHGMDPREEQAMLGEPMSRFVRELMEQTRQRGGYRVHFVTAREMVNMIFAACDGREGNPGAYRDFRFRLLSSTSTASGAGLNELASASTIPPPHQRVQ